MPAPTCGPNVMAVNAPSATPKTVEPGECHEAPTAGGIHQDGRDDAGEQADAEPPSIIPTTSGRIPGSTAKPVASPIAA